MFNLLGGPSHIDMFDLKPDAPEGIRGEFRPMATSLPGLQICEHLPRLARWMHRATLIRSFSHSFNSHDPLPFMTGFTDNRPLDQASSTDPPDIGAICQYLGLGPADLPGCCLHAVLPGFGQKGWRRRGPYGGFLGQPVRPALHALQADASSASRRSTTTIRSCRSENLFCRGRIRSRSCRPFASAAGARCSIKWTALASRADASPGMATMDDSMNRAVRHDDVRPDARLLSTCPAEPARSARRTARTSRARAC